MSRPFQSDLRLGDYREVLAGVKADLIFASPPYNIGLPGPAKSGIRPGYEHSEGNSGYKDDLPEAKYQEQQVEFLIRQN
jgi:hypothetical protein